MLRTRLALAIAVTTLATGIVALLPAAAGAAHSTTATAAGVTAPLADNAQWG